MALGEPDERLSASSGAGRRRSGWRASRCSIAFVRGVTAASTTAASTANPSSQRVGTRTGTPPANAMHGS